MFGLLCLSKAVCSFHLIVPDAQKVLQIVLRNVALSGFPTALERTLWR